MLLVLLLSHLHICAQLHHHSHLQVQVAPHYAPLEDITLAPSPNSTINYAPSSCPTPTSMTSAYLFPTASSFSSSTCPTLCTSGRYHTGTVSKFYNQLCSPSYSYHIYISVPNCIIIFIFKLPHIMHI
jgi:hypothetical protein